MFRSVSLRGVGLRTVLASPESDSAKFQPVRIHLFREYLRKNKFLREILICLSGAEMGSLKNANKSCDTATLMLPFHLAQGLRKFWLLSQTKYFLNLTFFNVAPETKFVLQLVKKQKLKRIENKIFFPCTDQKQFCPFLEEKKIYSIN